MKIDINPALQTILDSFANADGCTTEVWTERKVNGLLRSLWKESVVQKINVSKIEDVAAFDAAITPVNTAIKNRDTSSVTEPI